MPPPIPPRFTGTFDLTNSMTQVIEATVKMTVEETLAQLEILPVPPAAAELLTKQEAAELLKVSVATLDKMRREGHIKAAYIGTAVRIPSTEITKHLEDLR